MTTTSLTNSKPVRMKTKSQFEQYLKYNPIFGVFTLLSDNSDPLANSTKISLTGRVYVPRLSAWAMVNGHTPDFTLKNLNGNDHDLRIDNIGKHANNYSEHINMPEHTTRSPMIKPIEPNKKIEMTIFRKGILDTITAGTNDNTFKSATVKHILMSQGIVTLHMIEIAFKEFEELNVLTYIGGGNYKVDMDLVSGIVTVDNEKNRKPTQAMTSSKATKEVYEDMINNPVFGSDMLYGEFPGKSAPKYYKSRLVQAGYIPCSLDVYDIKKMQFQAFTCFSFDELDGLYHRAVSASKSHSQKNKGWVGYISRVILHYATLIKNGEV